MLNWISGHKILTAFICCSMIFLPILIIHVLFKIRTGIYWIEAEWEAGEVLGYFGDVLSFVGTIILGAIAIFQTEKANNLNEELLDIERNRIKPCIDVENSHLYNIFLSEDIYKQFSKFERTERMTIEILYTQNPRTGYTTDSALIELEVHNSGGSDISQIYINDAECYLCVNDPHNNSNKKIGVITGNTGLKIDERRTLYIYIKREICSSSELYDNWYIDNCQQLMPHIEFDLVLETTVGERFLEKLSLGSGWDASMKNNGATLEREISIEKREISKVQDKKK